MYIAPNSTIALLSGVICDANYTNTLYFSGANAQAVYFLSKAVKRFDNNSYQRYDKNALRVECTADDVYSCNYLMFRNTNYGDKWFYAFITDIRYVNNITTEIHYSIDVMQTWYFDYTTGMCMVEREHTLTDVIGENTLPEPCGAGEVVTQDVQSYLYTDTPAMFDFVVYYVPAETGQIITGYSDNEWKTGTNKELRGTIFNGIYTGALECHYPMVLGSSTTATKKIIDQLFHKLDEINANIVSVQQVPLDPFVDAQTGNYAKNWSITQPLTFKDNNDTYTPINKKCYSYPYSFVRLSNNKGVEQELMWENVNPQGTAPLPTGAVRMDMEVMSAMQPICEISCRPKNYAGEATNYDSGVLLNDFPMPSWSENTFDRWWAVNKYQFMYNTVTDAITTLANVGGAVAVGGAVGAGMSVASATPALGVGQAVVPRSPAASIGAQTLGGMSGGSTGSVEISATPTSILPVVDNIVEYATRKQAASQGKGNIATSGLPILDNRIGFTCYCMGSKPEYIRIADNYFSMFGYRIARLKTLNVRTAPKESLRPSWNYVKTSMCNITALNAPASVGAQIQNVYNNGITFWMNPLTAGDYTKDNNPQI